MYGQLGHNSNQCESLPRKVFELMGCEVTMLACGRLVAQHFHCCCYSDRGKDLVSYLNVNVVKHRRYVENLLLVKE